MSISQPLVSASHTAGWPICPSTRPKSAEAETTPYEALGECSAHISANLGFLAQIKPVHLHPPSRGSVYQCGVPKSSKLPVDVKPISTLNEDHREMDAALASGPSSMTSEK
ncbi:Olfactory receptor 5M8 [Clarias magur]|uniref:Olfactory receptor 5M8 n=1 Tax=Clarias magur TaxID=1594786 RepID=A0A8J4UD59_CLAMG|nr:Olfactory receptor 5M8 [Clarias magur]